MYEQFNNSVAFSKVKVGQQFIERILGRSILYQRIPDGRDSDDGSEFNAMISDAGAKEPCYFYPDDEVFIAG